MKILICEDDFVARRVIKDILMPLAIIQILLKVVCLIVQAVLGFHFRVFGEKHVFDVGLRAQKQEEVV